ncbi:MAG: helix-turn-helix domain-containing protein [Bulleidia sp.]
MNKLPEKLTLLRKYNQFSQTDVAEKLNVPVTEYMNWENGNSICRIDQLKILSELFGVSVDALLDNTKTIVIPEEELAKSAEIPSFSNNAMEQTQQMTPVDAQAGTIQMNTLSDALGETKVVSPQSLQDTEKEEEEEEEKPVRKKKAGADRPASAQKKKNSWIILAVAALLVVIAAGVLLFLNGSHKVALSKDNRLAVGDTYSLYVDQNSQINVRGDFTADSKFTEGVQVSAYEDHAAALTAKGKVIDSLGLSGVSSWKKIDYIAAGKSHTVGVTDEGKVVCEGSEQACQVENWSNISAVYAGNEITVGITNDGKVKVSGNQESLSTLTGVSDLAISSSLIAAAKTDGTVVTSMLGATTPLDTSAWMDVKDVAVGNDLVVGLTGDGSVLCETTDETMKETVTAWKNIRYIAASGNTVIAIDRSGNMYGAGDNSHNQYENQGTTENNEDKEDEKLDDPQNITVTESTANVVIKWDTVKNADSYLVSISNIGDLPESKNNQASLSASSFTDGETYTITVTAKPKSSSKTKESSSTITYTYEAKKIQLTTPSGITASTDSKGWTIQWAAVDHADYYEISLDGNAPQRANINSFIYDTSQIISVGNHTISIKAFSVNSTYTESEEGTGVVQYEPQMKTIPIMYIQGESTYVDAGNPTVDVYVGMDYTYQDLDNMAGGFATAAEKTLTDPTGTVHIYDTTTSIQIYLNE